PGDLPREPSAPGQQRLPPAGAPLRLEDAPEGREEPRGRRGRAEARHRHRRPAPDARGGGDGGVRMSAPVVVLGYVAFAGLILSIAAYAASAAALLAARRRSRGEPVPGWEPGVATLKPLCGVDESLEETLESFFGLDYAHERYEILFSFASESDPAYPIARRVADRHPRISAVFVFDPREPGGNAKVNRLTAALR